MKTYFVGTGLDSFSTTGVVTDTGTSIQINQSESRPVYGWFVDPSTQARAAQRVFYCHVVTSRDGGSSGQHGVQLMDASEVAIVRLNGAGTLSFWDGSSYTTAGSLPSFNNGEHVLDFFVDMDGGALKMWQNGSLVIDETGVNFDTAGDPVKLTIDRWTSFNSNAQFSQCIVAEYNTVGHTVRRRAATGDSSTNTAWAGSYTDIAKTGINDSTNITSDSAGQDETFTAGNLSATPSNQFIKCVAIAARGKNDGGSAPQNFRGLLRIGSTNYAASGDVPLNDGYQGTISIFDVNPSTTNPWADISEVNATEFGVRSAA